MMVAGLMGMPRRIQTYPDELRLGALERTRDARRVHDRAWRARVHHQLHHESCGTARRAGDDPWDGRTLEWTLPSPRAAIQLQGRSRRSTRSTTSGTGSTPRTAKEARSRSRPAPRWLRAATATSGDGTGRRTRHPPAVAVVHAASGRASGSRSWASAWCTARLRRVGLARWWSAIDVCMRPLIAVGVAIIVVGIYGWALEPATEEDRSRVRMQAPERGEHGDMAHALPLADTATTWRRTRGSTTASC